MQLTTEQLRQIINEEISLMIKEGFFGFRSKKEKRRDALKDKLAQYKSNRMSPTPPSRPDMGDEMLSDLADMGRQLDPSYQTPEEMEQAEIDRYLSLPKSEKTKYIMSLPKEKRREFMRKASGKTPLQEEDDMGKIVSPDIIKQVDAVAADLKELPALDKAVEDAATKIAGGNEQLAQVIIPLIRQKFAEA